MLSAGCWPEPPYARAEPEAVDDDRQVPLNARLLARDVREARLRIRHPFHVLAERAVVVDARRARQEQAVLPAELLLRVEAERVVPRPAVRRETFVPAEPIVWSPGAGKKSPSPWM